MTDDGAFIEGCDKKGGEVFRKPLQVHSEDAQPNLTDNSQIHNNRLYSLAPASRLRDMVDCYLHDMKDPGLTADVAWFHAQTALQEELTISAKTLKARLHSNHD